MESNGPAIRVHLFWLTAALQRTATVFTVMRKALIREQSSAED